MIEPTAVASIARSLLAFVCAAMLTVLPMPSASAQDVAPQRGPAQAPTPEAGTAEADSAAKQQALMKSDRFRHLASELRCLVCQNQTLEDSNAPLAQDLREEVARLMAGGRDDRQIKAYLVDRYGEFVLYRPSVSTRTALLWFGPFLLLIAGAVAWWRLGRRRAQPPQSARDALQRVDDLLGQ
jgi:cytochrome c-type biogenesis protein CcmH